LTARAQALDDREDGLNDREYELDSREDDLVSREEEVEEILNSPEENTQPSGNSIDISNVAKSLAAMEPANAASMLASTTDLEYAVAVLRAMKNKEQGAILDAMAVSSPEVAVTYFDALGLPQE
jgi:flagellar motility protein MotE (MotC chaperone)